MDKKKIAPIYQTRKIVLGQYFVIIFFLTISISCSFITKTISDSNINLPIPKESITINNSDRVKQLARWGNGIVQAVTWSPNGEILAVAGTLGIHFYDPKSLKIKHFILTNSRVNSLSFSSDGIHLAYGLGDGSAWLWNNVDNTVKQLVDNSRNHDSSVAFSPDGTLLGIGTKSSLRIWHIEDDRLLSTIERVNADFARSIEFSPDGLYLASTFENNILIFSVPDGHLIRTLEGNSKDVTSVAYSPNGIYLASAARGGSIRIWRTLDGAELNVFSGDSSLFDNIVAFSKSANLVAYPSEFNSIRLYNVSDGTQLGDLVGNSGRVISIAFSPDGNFLATASRDNTISIWQISNKKLLSTISGYTSAVRSIDFSPEGKYFAAGFDDDGMLVWRFPAGKPLNYLDKDSIHPIDNVNFSPDGKIISYAQLVRIHVLQSSNLEPLIPPIKHKSGVRSAAISPDGAMLASGLSDHTVRIWDIKNGSLVNTLEGHTGKVKAVAFSPNGDLLASASNFTVWLWRLPSGELINLFEGHPHPINDIDFSNGGDLLGVAAGKVFIWDISSMKQLHEIENYEEGGELSVAFSPTGDIIASGSFNGAIQLWRVSDSALLTTLRGHTDNVTDLVFSSDGRYLASSSEDGSIQFWGISP